MTAALYVDITRGPYPGLGVDCWGSDRDATTYPGPGPVLAHPPCGHWGRYHRRAHDDGRTGPIAVAQVQRWGGVLEQPAHSRLWQHCGLPRPGEDLDVHGGYLVFQRDWGHRADKPTWLYIVGCQKDNLPPMPPSTPARHAIVEKRRVLVLGADRRPTRGIVECMSRHQRHLTPVAFAQWLLAVAERCKENR